MSNPESGVAVEKVPAGDAEAAARFEAFAQEKYYQQAWQPLIAGASRGAHRFNWAAAIFGIAWCFYRKMYVTGLLLLASVFVAVFLVAVAAAIVVPDLDLEHTGVAAAITAISLLVIRAVFGFLANKLYFRKASRVIAKAMARNPPEDKLFEYLRKRGGTSEVSVAVAIAINLAVRFLFR